jgi:hypothetical protein
MNDIVGDRLTRAILALTKELKRYNDANEPPAITVRRFPEPAELYKGAYSREEIERREEGERLSQLHPAESSLSAQIEKPGGNPPAPRADGKIRRRRPGDQ